jgi:hypothetical protein
LSVFTDPMSENVDGSDWRWVADTVWVTEEEAKDLWPEFKDQITFGDWFRGTTSNMPPELVGKTADQDKLILDEKKKRVRLLEYWYKRYESVNVAVMPDTGDVRVADEAFMAAYSILDPIEQAKVKFIRRKLPIIRVATVLNWLLLQDKPSPFNAPQFPIIPYVGILVNEHPHGIVESLKDAQRIRNKAYSALLNHLNRSANSGWMNKADGGADPKILEAFGSRPGIVINYKDTPPTKIDPVNLSQGHFTIVKDVDQEFKEMTLLNAELQGVTTQTTISGRAIEARQRGGLVGNEDFFDNMLLGDKMLGYWLIQLVQQFYTPERVMRVADIRTSLDPQGQFAQMVLQKQGELPVMLDRLLKAEYDFVVDKAPNSVTVRATQVQMLMQMAQTFGPGSIPPDVIIDMMDIPTTAKQRIKQHLEQQQQLQQMLASMGGNGKGPGGPPQVPSPGGTGGPEEIAGATPDQVA